MLTKNWMIILGKRKRTKLKSCKRTGFSEAQEVRKVSKSKQKRAKSNGIFTNLISDLESLIQNSPTREVRMISGAEWSFGIGKLGEVEKLFQWEEQVIELQKEKDDLATRREVVGKESENSVISLL